MAAVWDNYHGWSGQWGPWRLDPDNGGALVHPNGYYIDLERCDEPAQVLDWIFQVAKKSWGGEPGCIAGLVQALDDVIAPQATLCSCGVASRLDPVDLSKAVRSSARRWPHLLWEAPSTYSEP